MRVFPILLSTLPLLAAGCGQCGLQTQSAVDVPVTLAAVQALHHPPEIVVAVTRKERHVGGGGCGHSALCALLIPVIVYDRIFPEKWDEATITDHGTITYEGRFRTDGDIIEARSRRDGFVRLITVLPLEKLKRRVVVEAARAPLLPGGKDGAFVKTPLLPQIDLPAEYTRALADEKDADDRADLLVEAGTWLGEDALPLLRKTLPGEGDEAASLTVKGLCQNPGEAQGKALRAEVLASLPVNPGPKTAAEGLSCAVLGHDAEAARPFAQALGAVICEDSNASVARDAARAFRTMSRAASEAKAGTELRIAEGAAATKLPLCTRPERKALLQLTTGLPVATADLEAALSDDALGDDIVSYLDTEKPGNRAAILAALPRRKFDSGLLGGLERATTWVPDERELEVLASAYPRTGTSLIGAGRDRSVFVLFARTKGDPARVAGARKSLEAVVAAAPVNDRPRLRAGLLMLGDRTQALPTSRGLEGMKRLPGFGAQESIVAALRLAGCEDEEILAAAKTAGAIKDDATGALCAR